MNLIQLLASKSNDEEVVSTFNSADYKSVKKVELQAIYHAISGRNSNFKKKDDAVQAIKLKLRNTQRALAFAGKKMCDSKDFVNELNSYLTTTSV